MQQKLFKMNIPSFLKRFKSKKKSTADVIFLRDHKTGFKLLRKISTIIKNTTKINLELRTYYLFWNNYEKEKKYVIIIRHPKEVIISGYLYHKRCIERWATIQNVSYYSGWEKNHFERKAIRKNKVYIKKAKTFSSPIPYQEKLNTLPQNEGIMYEMNSVSKLTIDGMYNLEHFGKPNTYMVKMEDLVFNHDDTILDLCDFLEINEKDSQEILAECLQHNLLNQKKKNQLTAHTTNVNVEKDRYKQYWNETIEAEFNRLFPKDVLSKFGYE